MIYSKCWLIIIINFIIYISFNDYWICKNEEKWCIDRAFQILNGCFPRYNILIGVQKYFHWSTMHRVNFIECFLNGCPMRNWCLSISLSLLLTVFDFIAQYIGHKYLRVNLHHLHFYEYLLVLFIPIPQLSPSSYTFFFRASFSYSHIFFFPSCIVFFFLYHFLICASFHLTL